MMLLGPSGLLFKVLGPTADYLGTELQGLAERRVQNLQRVFEKADRKLGPDPHGRAGAVPPRVLKGILEEGSYWDDELGAEYLGGVLASSRTEAPRDDRAASLVALVGRLSTYALRLHYAMYAGARPSLIGSDCRLGLQHERARGAKFFMTFECFVRSLEFSTDEGPDLNAILSHAVHALLREGLIDDLFAYGPADALREAHGNRFQTGGLVYVISPFGIELFCSAHGHRGEAISAFTDPKIDFEFEEEVDIAPAPILVKDMPEIEVPPETPADT
jgi:hypothetical protein